MSRNRKAGLSGTGSNTVVYSSEQGHCNPHRAIAEARAEHLFAREA
jgi:hypothetical protein